MRPQLFLTPQEVCNKETEDSQVDWSSLSVALDPERGREGWVEHDCESNTFMSACHVLTVSQGYDYCSYTHLPDGKTEAQERRQPRQL